MATRKNGKGAENVAAGAASPVTGTTGTNDTSLALIEKVYAGLYSFVGQSVEVHAVQTALNTKRDRMTDVLLRAGMDAGTVEVFDPARDRLYAEIRANKRGIAAKLGAEKDAEGNYKIPKSVQVYISEVRTTLARGGKFTDDSGNVLSFGKIRAANKEAREAAEAAQRESKMGPDDKARARITALLTAVIDAAGKTEGAALAALLAQCESFVHGLATGKTETPAESIAAAA